MAKNRPELVRPRKVEIPEPPRTAPNRQTGSGRFGSNRLAGWAAGFRHNQPKTAAPSKSLVCPIQISALSPPVAIHHAAVSPPQNGRRSGGAVAQSRDLRAHLSTGRDRARELPLHPGRLHRAFVEPQRPLQHPNLLLLRLRRHLRHRRVRRHLPRLLSSFLFSSLIALGLKQAIRISRFHHAYRAYVHTAGLRLGMLVAAVGSVCGCAFLMMALVNVIQIKLGTLACGSSHSYAAVVPLVIFVSFGLLIYVSMVLYAFTR